MKHRSSSRILLPLFISIASLSPFALEAKRTKKATSVVKKEKKSFFKSLSTSLKDMDYAKLKENKDKQIAKKSYDTAALYLEQMIPLCADINERKDLQFELAEQYLQGQHLEKASTHFKEFVQLYPSDAKAEEAEYKAIIALFNRTLEPDRDQTLTKETIELTTKFLERDIYTTYRDNVLSLRTKCYEKLVASDVNIVDFYINRGDFIAAQQQIATMEKEFTKVVTNLKPIILQLKYAVADKRQNTEQAVALLAELQQEVLKEFSISPADQSVLLVQLNQSNILDPKNKLVAQKITFDTSAKDKKITPKDRLILADNSRKARDRF